MGRPGRYRAAARDHAAPRRQRRATAGDPQAHLHAGRRRRRGEAAAAPHRRMPSPRLWRKRPREDFLPVEPETLPSGAAHGKRGRVADPQVPAGSRRRARPRHRRPGQAAVHAGRRAAAADEVRSARGLSRLRADERLRLPAHRPGPRAGPPATPSTARTSARRRCRWPTTSTASGASRSPSSIRRPTTCKRAFEDLLINKRMLRPARPGDQLRPRLVPVRRRRQRQDEHRRARSPRPSARSIWIPRAIGIDGEIMRLFDPGNARGDAAAEPTGGLLDQRKIDNRWVRIRRPTIVVGGELTMDNLEVTLNTLDRHQRSAAAAEEQLRHAGDRRLRPPADDAPTSCSIAGSCRWKSGTTS